MEFCVESSGDCQGFGGLSHPRLGQCSTKGRRASILEVVVFVAPASRRWSGAATQAENPPAGRRRHENRSANASLAISGLKLHLW